MTSAKRSHTGDEEDDADDSLPFLEFPSSLSGLDIEVAPQPPVPIVDLSASPVPPLEFPLSPRPGRFSSSFSDTAEDGASREDGADDSEEDDDNDSDRFKSFGYLICDVFEVFDTIDAEAIVTSSDEVAIDQVETQSDREEDLSKPSPLPDDEEIPNFDDATEAAQEVD